MATGLDEFHQHLLEISKVAMWVLPTAAFTPVIASLVDLNPPWPNRLGLTAATCAVVLFTLVAVFQFLDSRRTRRVNLVMSISLVAGILIACTYFTLFAFLVFKPTNGDAFVKGFTCTPNALQVFTSKCPWLDIDELKSAEYEETRLWTVQSILISRVSLVFVWFIMFVSLATCLGAFVRHQSRKKSSLRQ